MSWRMPSAAGALALRAGLSMVGQSCGLPVSTPGRARRQHPVLEAGINRTAAEAAMYRPAQFDETRPEILTAAMAEIQLAAFVTPTAAGIEVTHAPAVVRTGADGTVVLESHVARANPHWRAAADAPSVAIFQGPQAYVSPSFYPSKKEHGKVVPTWTYVTVHAHGRLAAVEDGDWLAAHLEALTAQNESRREAPWAVSDAPAEFIGALTRGIVGLRMTVERLEGAWKVNQHKSAPDREGTAAGLAASGEMGEKLAAVLARS